MFFRDALSGGAFALAGETAGQFWQWMTKATMWSSHCRNRYYSMDSIIMSIRTNLLAGAIVICLFATIAPSPRVTVWYCPVKHVDSRPSIDWDAEGVGRNYFLASSAPDMIAVNGMPYVKASTYRSSLVLISYVHTFKWDDEVLAALLQESGSEPADAAR